ncbi:unnamed protein product [Cuscuta epithymum]|uniref:Reticulon-like protein n=1 Tax=Cuscuta epithymum TaxID=186058 RepID=A0AAV0D199_9ASTE|nr:unnamed protein product [Cuscuta epithymum]
MADGDQKLESKSRHLFGRQQSIHKFLGGGKLGDVVLWRNKRTSARILAGATLTWLLLQRFEFRVLELASHALILTLAIFFSWSNANALLNKSLQPIPKVHIPEKTVLQITSHISFAFNKCFLLLHQISLGRDSTMFLKVISGLWIFAILGGSCDFLTLIYICVIILLTVPVVYEKYEEEVDAFAEKGKMEIKKYYAWLHANVLSKIPRGHVKETKLIKNN